ncbi:MAG: hypothetical protein NW217_05600 [Hyphomicrobiaceae bacterium]|nr:hypothetical protein [Hyphomicrobiaceae bacterium]
MRPLFITTLIGLTLATLLTVAVDPNAGSETYLYANEMPHGLD